MNKHIKFILISIIILFLLMYGYFVAFLYYSDLRAPAYSYGVGISTDKTLTNVTLIIPMPVKENKTIDLSRINDTPYVYEKYHDWINPSGLKGWNITITDTPYGPMLKLKRDRVTPDMSGDLLYMTKAVNYSVNVYDPFQNDILIRPRENHENPAKYQEKLQLEYEIPFSTYAYISYDKTPEINNALATISINLKLFVSAGVVEHESRYKDKWYTGEYFEYPGGSLNPGWNTLNGTTKVQVGQFRNVPGWLEIISLGAFR
jgi:hypothetical protein